MDYFAKTIVRSNDLVSRTIDGEAFLMTEDGQKIHMINKVGTIIWECSDGNMTIQDIIAKVLNRFDTDTDTAKNDCLEFIDTLLEKKLISLSEKVLSI